MSLSSETELESDASHSNRAAWLWLGVGAIAVIATVFGFLHAGRSFWRVIRADTSHYQLQA